MGSLSAPAKDMSAPKRKLNLTGLSGQFAVRSILADMNIALRDWGIENDQLDRVELLASEALNNVFEHAYRYENDRPFSVDLELSGFNLTIRLLDNGAPMPGLKLPDPEPNPPLSPDTERDALPEGGWGWDLIHMLSDRIKYERRDGANLLILDLNIAPVN